MSDGGGSDVALLRFLAVGRLVALPDGRWAEGKHQLLCSYAPKDDREVKAYKSHIKAIMNKGANKLQPGKRIRLTSDNNDYDLQVLADHAEDDPSNTLIFFAVTDPSFAKHHTVSALLRDFKKDFYEAVQARDLQAAGTTTTGGLQRQCTPLLQRLYATYNVSKLREVQAKVEKVKSVMKDNVGQGADERGAPGGDGDQGRAVPGARQAVQQEQRQAQGPLPLPILQDQPPPRHTRHRHRRIHHLRYLREGARLSAGCSRGAPAAGGNGVADGAHSLLHGGGIVPR